jgi:hypothetical protein
MAASGEESFFYFLIGFEIYLEQQTLVPTRTSPIFKTTWLDFEEINLSRIHVPDPTP